MYVNHWELFYNLISVYVKFSFGIYNNILYISKYELRPNYGSFKYIYFK